MTPTISANTRRYALFLLFTAYVLNYVDRQVISILQEPIKTELGLSDTQLGLMTGLSFALFYATLGVPIARYADSHSRKRIIAVAMALWSGMTALCGTAQSFATLLLYRVGVGVGEAGLTPPAHSLISDYYEPRRRAAALAIYSAAGTVGLMVGSVAAGRISDAYGWRVAVIAAGLPGLLLALLIWLTLREPARGRFEQAPAGALPTSLIGGLATLLRNPAFRWLALGCGFHTFVTYGQGNWTAPFLGRLHGMTSSEIGNWIAILSAGPGLIGMMASGYVADWVGRRRPRARMEVAMVSMILIIPFEIGSILATDTHVALAFFAGSFLLAGAYLGPSIAAAHALFPAGVRASASAIIMLGINLIGLGLGPLVTGALSDLWAAQGTHGLRHAMVAIVPAELIGIGFFLLAMRQVRRQQESETRN